MGKTKDYEIGICCFYAALRCKSKDWLTQIHDNAEFLLPLFYCQISAAFPIKNRLLIAIFQLHHGINKFYFNEMMMRSALF
jgi:hypothetical protein